MCPHKSACFGWPAEIHMAAKLQKNGGYFHEKIPISEQAKTAFIVTEPLYLNRYP